MPISRVNKIKPAQTVSSADISTQTPVDEPELEDPSPNYTVGYRKPPPHTQFKPGQSGNPRGRPKGAKSLMSMALAMLNERVTVKTQNGTRTMSKIEALLQKQMEKASKGDDKATKLLLEYYSQALSDEQSRETGAMNGEKTSASDKAVLDLLREQFSEENILGGSNDD